MHELSLAHLSVLDVEFLRFEPELPQGIPEGFLESDALLDASTRSSRAT